MYRLNDTIVAVSSPTSSQRVIVRLSGPGTIDVLRQIFSPSIPKKGPVVVSGSVVIDSELRIDAKLYLFLGPDSYTGEDVAEIHLCTNPAVTEALISSLVAGRSLPGSRVTSHESRVRMAGPGEFTARAYLNGKMDLSAAEAVNEIIVSSNKFQLAASEKLLAGRLAETTAKLRSEIMDCLSLIEAGLDFSGEALEFMTNAEAVERLTQIKVELERLFSGSISYEEVVDLPAVGIAGAPNAGKSSLLNKLLVLSRSIVSEQRKTTRDVLTGLLTLKHCKCVLFDCAGLIPSLVARRSSLGSRVTGDGTRALLDELAQQAATEALRNSSVVVFCIDISKTDYSEDIAICELLYSSCVVRDAYCVKENAPEAVRDTRYAIRNTNLITVATKCDLLSEEDLAKRLVRLNDVFNADFLATSAKAGVGADLLKGAIDRRLIELAVGGAGRNSRYEIRDTKYEIALTARHRQAVIEAIENTEQAINELKAGNDEVAAMMLRAAYQSLSTVEQQNIDEKILERIFSRFCIGK